MFEFLKDKNKKKQFYFSYIVFFINGMLALSIGSILPYIRTERNLTYAFCGLLVSLHSIGNVFSSFAGGILPVFIGRKRCILIFNACFAISYLLIIFGTGNWVLAIAFLMTGLARGATSNFCNVNVNSLAPGKAWIINCLHATFSAGAFIFPILLMLITSSSKSHWVYACYIMAGMGFLSWILYFIMPVAKTLEKKAGEQEKSSKKDFGFLKSPLFYLCTSTLFFYLCVEQGVIGWLITYFDDTGLLDPIFSQIMASVLWVTILTGRLTTAWLSTRVNQGKLLLGMGIGLVLFFFLLFSSKTPVLITAGIIGFGFSMSGIYPTIVSFTGKLIQKYAIAWSFILTMASFGSIIMPSVIGKIAENMGIFYGMSSIVVVVFIELSLIISLVIYTNRKGIVE